MGKKAFVLFVALLAMLITFGVIIVSDGKQTAIFSGHPDQKPIMYEDGSGHIAGAGVEITKIVLGKPGITARFPYLGSWDVVLNDVKTGVIDGVVGAYWNSEREQYAIFLGPYTNDSIVLFFPEGKSFKYTKKADLVGKIGIITKGDSYGEEWDQFIKTNLTMLEVPDPKTAFEDLKAGKADYFIYALWAGRNVIAEYDLTGFEESAVVANQPFYIMISKRSPYSSPEYTDQFNKTLGEMKASGEIDRIIANVSAWNKIQHSFFYPIKYDLSILLNRNFKLQYLYNLISF
jgi:polar amino acid transport system substrate-binding protein